VLCGSPLSEEIQGRFLSQLKAASRTPLVKKVEQRLQVRVSLAQTKIVASSASREKKKTVAALAQAIRSAAEKLKKEVEKLSKFICLFVD